MRLTRTTTSQSLVLLKQFYLESEAAIYAARLREEGIEVVLQNDTIYAMLPVGEKGIRLFVPQADAAYALQLIRQMDENKVKPLEESFHDADLEDILYQKQLHEGQVSKHMMYVALAMSVVLVIYVCYLSSGGRGLYH